MVRKCLFAVLALIVLNSSARPDSSEVNRITNNEFNDWDPVWALR